MVQCSIGMVDALGAGVASWRPGNSPADHIFGIVSIVAFYFMAFSHFGSKIYVASNSLGSRWLHYIMLRTVFAALMLIATLI